MSEFRELWKHPNNPRALKVSRVFIMLKMDTIRKKKKKKVLKVKVSLRKPGTVSLRHLFHMELYTMSELNPVVIRRHKYVI